MTARFQRYAIYWTPEPESRLTRFGEVWFANAGDDAHAGTLETFGLPAGFAYRATKTPARYGLHATLKAPFRLRENGAEAELQKALDIFNNHPDEIVTDAQRWLSNDTTNQMNDLFTKFFNDPNYTVDQAQADYVNILKNAN